MDTSLHPVDFTPAGRRVLCPEGTTLLEAARQAGLAITVTCNGKGTCGKCRVQARGALQPPTEQEARHLRPAELAAGYRLACQTRLHGAATVRVFSADPTAYKAAARASDHRGPPAPHVRKVYLRLPHPSLLDQRADLERLCTPLDIPTTTVTLPVLRALPAALRAADWAVTAVLAGHRLLGAEAGDTRQRSYGLALDLGTTTAAAYLVSLSTGQVHGVALATNRQAAYGDDVISRLDHAHAGGLSDLQAAAVETLNLLAQQLCRQAAVSPQHIYEATVVGNTCMVQLLLGIDPYPIGVAPYVPAVTEALDLAAQEVGLDLAIGARVHVLPAVAGYVGADAVANALVSSQRGPDKVRLIMDIGTNAEMVLCGRGRMWACAAAAGPAFEGARISCGMRAAPGAIDRVTILGTGLEVHTLEDRPPVGLAGSGLVSAAAALRRHGLLTNRGRFLPTGAPGLFFHDEELQLLLVPADRSGTGRAIGLTQRDIAELLLAKAAIATGARVLLAEAGLEASDIDEVLLAGSFGNFLDKEEARDIGLFPQVPLERVIGVGNAAGTGAILALISEPLRLRAQEIARQIEYVELSARPDFSTGFVRAMAFPELEFSNHKDTEAPGTALS
jgi:uncharacterized 2Fe-2S/4Fe-4S cluster protein (DUF4445 family)